MVVYLRSSSLVEAPGASSATWYAISRYSDNSALSHSVGVPILFYFTSFQPCIDVLYLAYSSDYVVSFPAIIISLNTFIFNGFPYFFEFLMYLVLFLK